MRPDRKTPCASCGRLRSHTLMLPDGTCVFCTEECLGYFEEPVQEPVEGQRSVWCECRTCLVHYAVVHVDDLKARPKCHFCRAGQAAPAAECARCRNRFLFQSGERS